MKWWKFLFFVLYIVLGFYFVNLAIEFYTLPDFLTGYDKWFFLVGGAVILIESINMLKRHVTKKNK